MEAQADFSDRQEERLRGPAARRRLDHGAQRLRGELPHTAVHWGSLWAIQAVIKLPGPKVRGGTTG
ncbi:hypothetical protein [Streptomyces sp. NPDC058613]|uniref:hypothetical protein n=1 Tax=unclassified Streptomyces TaxID=2593676 RepID=UPI003668AE5A